MTDPTTTALGAATASAQAQLDRLLVERGQLRALLELTTSAEHRPAFETALTRLDGDIAALLSRWRQAGGHIALTGTVSAPNRSATPTASGADRGPRSLSPVVTRHRRSSTPPAPERRGRTEVRLPPRESVDDDWRDTFGQLMSRLGPGHDLAGEIDIVVEAAVACDRWVGFPKHVQRHLVGLLACRLRSLQDEQGVPEYELQDGFSALTRFSKRVKPGFVFGLSRSHRPQHGDTWDADAVRHWDQLAALIPSDHDLNDEQDALLEKLAFLANELDDAPSDDARETVRTQALRVLGEALEAGVDARNPSLVALALPLQPIPDNRAMMRLRHAVRDAIAPIEDSDEGLDIEPDWGWWVHTRGKRALIVGGTPRDAVRDTIERAFGFSAVRWTDLDTARRLLAASDVDMLLVMDRWLDDVVEADLLPIARARSIPFVHVDHGSSVALVKSAIERFTEREGEATL